MKKGKKHNALACLIVYGWWSLVTATFISFFLFLVYLAWYCVWGYPWHLGTDGTTLVQDFGVLGGGLVLAFWAILAVSWFANMVLDIWKWASENC